MTKILNPNGDIAFIGSDYVGPEMRNYIATMVRTLGEHSPASWPISLTLTGQPVLKESGEEVFGVSSDGNVVVSLDKVLQTVGAQVASGKEVLHPEKLAFLVLSEAVAHEILHACFPELSEEQVSENAKQITHLMIEQYVSPSEVGEYMSQKLGELVTKLPSGHPSRHIVEAGVEVDNGNTKSFREYIRYGLVERTGQEIHWDVPMELPTNLISAERAENKKETDMNENITNGTEIEDREIEHEVITETISAPASEPEKAPADVVMIDTTYTYEAYKAKGWTDKQLVDNKLARWINPPAPPVAAPVPPAAPVAPAPPVNAAPAAPMAPPTAGTAAPQGVWTFDPSKIVTIPVDTGGSIPLTAPGGSVMSSIKTQPYEGHNIPGPAVKAIVRALARMAWNHMFIGCQYMGPRPDHMNSFANPGYITTPFSLKPLEEIHKQANLVVRDFQVPGGEDGGFQSTMVDGHFICCGYLSQANRPMIKVLLDEGDGILCQMMMFAQRTAGTDSPSSRANVAKVLAGTRMLWVRYQKGDGQGSLAFAVEDNNGDGVLSERWLKQTGVQTALSVQGQRDPNLVARQLSYRATSQAAPAVPATNVKLQMIAKDFTYEQYKEAKWTDEQLVKAGKAMWVQAAPAYNPAPMQAAPAGPAGPADEELDEFASLNQFPA